MSTYPTIKDNSYITPSVDVITGYLVFACHYSGQDLYTTKSCTQQVFFIII